MYLIGALLLAAGIGLIVYLTGGESAKPPPPPTPAKTEEPPPPTPAPPPPPPPASASADAGDDAGAESKDGGGGRLPAGAVGSCSKCNEGVSNSALNGAVQAAAGSARGCYNRALQKNAGAAGKMVVSVQVGSTGQVCGANITNDSVGSPEVSNCVLGRFQGKSFPRPDKGCVTINVPLSFEVKQ
jgi:outer membrane biosynthesis protein TonB